MPKNKNPFIIEMVERPPKDTTRNEGWLRCPPEIEEIRASWFGKF